MLISNVNSTEAFGELEKWYTTPSSVNMSIPQVTCQREKSRGISKKKKRIRTAFTTSQLLALEARYKLQRYLTREERGDMALRFGIGDQQVKVWFQNRRMKEKKSSSPQSDYDFSSDKSSEITNSPSIADSSGLSDIVRPMRAESSLRDSPQIHLSITDSQSDMYLVPDSCRGLSDIDSWVKADSSLREYPQSHQPIVDSSPDMYMLPDTWHFSQGQNNQNVSHAQSAEPEPVKNISENSRQWNWNTSNAYSSFHNPFTYAYESDGAYFQTSPDMTESYDNIFHYDETQNQSQSQYDSNYQYPNVSTPTYVPWH